MGALFNGTCYNSLNEATHAYWTSVPASITAGANSFLIHVRYEPTTEKWMTYHYGKANPGLWTYQGNGQLPTLSLPECDPAESFLDGVTVGWGVGSVLIAVAALMMMKRAAR